MHSAKKARVFHEGEWKTKLPKKITDRNEAIILLCKDKLVLHLGCVDYPYTREQIRDDRFLHTKIMSVARDVIGVDKDEKGIKALSEMGINNIMYADVENIADLKLPIFEVIVAGELLEHLKNPGLFLDAIKKYMREDSLLIVSVPNAFCLRNFMKIPLGMERVHPGHFYYFSHATLSSLLQGCGFTIIDRSSYRFKGDRMSLASIAEKIASLISPNYCEGIIHVAKRSQTNSEGG